MRDVTEHHRSLEHTLAHVTDLIERQAVVSSLAARQDSSRQMLVQTLVERQHLAELERILNRLHPADAAFVLENLSADRRRSAWMLVRREHRGAILLETTATVRHQLISQLERDEVISVARQLDSGQLAALVQDLPPDLARDMVATL